ncbi:MAG: AAA family ATPase [Thermoflexibacter sp.]|jgi:AAA15 family ATPase/GTPase|nr:AAA family ATPase [Thermoflexibacter sp.]
MEETHLSYFQIENFKRFEKFELKDIGQFNLILGDNNVGKTTLLEALLFDEKDAENYIFNLISVLQWRKIISPKKDLSDRIAITTNYLDFFLNKSSIISKNVKINFQFFLKPIQHLSILVDESVVFKMQKVIQSNEYDELKNELMVLLEVDGTKSIIHQKLPLMRIRTNQVPIPLIPFSQNYDEDLVDYYTTYIQQSEKAKESFLQSLAIFIPNIKDVEPTKYNNISSLGIREKNVDRLAPLSFYGDGVNRLVRILLQMLTCSGKRLMIDEIDAGIHFKRLKDFWSVVLQAAKLNKVQLFATTHNIECLQYFKEVLEEEKLQNYQNNARCIELLELPDKSIKAYTYPFEKFAALINTNTNIRGGAYNG